MARMVAESRPYDAFFDPTTTTPYINNVQADPRVRAAASVPDAVAGTERAKYFKRPIMPRINAIPPQVLLAPPEEGEDPMAPIEDKEEAPFKDAEVQTLYRDGEAQTDAYTPEYIVPTGTDPELLMLDGLTQENGLPIGRREVQMIEHARRKRKMQQNLPPFTDEAHLMLRKKLLERQEMREFKLREEEIDNAHAERLQQVQEALEQRDAADEFLAEQRVEALRQRRMEEREQALERVRKRRIKTLRKLVNRRKKQVPTLSGATKRDIVADYFNAASEVYAPVRREGRFADTNAETYDIRSRAQTLDDMNSIAKFESTLPSGLSSTMPRRPLPSAQAQQKDRKKLALTAEVEKMHAILQERKRRGGAVGAAAGATGGVVGPSSTAGGTGPVGSSTAGAGTVASGSGDARTAASGTASRQRTMDRPSTPVVSHDDDPSVTGISEEAAQAIVLLQRLLRGRTEQNRMFEGRYRMAALIHELRLADEMKEQVQAGDEQRTENEQKQRLRDTTIDAVSGSVASHLLNTAAQPDEEGSVDGAPES